MGTGVCAIGAYDGQALTARISLFSFSHSMSLCAFLASRSILVYPHRMASCRIVSYRIACSRFRLHDFTVTFDSACLPHSLQDIYISTAQLHI